MLRKFYITLIALLPCILIADWAQDFDQDCAAAVVAAIPTWVSAPNLIAHYKMNDNAASKIVIDSWTSGYNGTASTNTDQLTDAGKINLSFNYNGTLTNGVTIPYTSDLNFSSTPFSIALWFKTPSSHISQPLVTQIGGWNLYNAGTDVNGVMNFWNTINTIRAFTFLEASPPGTLTNSVWYHITLTYAAHYYHFYLNGVDSGTRYYVAPANNSADIVIGSQSTFKCDSDNYIDDVRFYKKELTQDEVNRIYNAGNGTEQE